MAVETAADRAVFVEADDFGVAAVYTPAGGSPVALEILLDEPHSFGDLGALGALQIGYVATVRDDDVPSPAAGDSLVVGARTFTVRRAEQDLSGAMWKLGLDLQ